MASIPCSCINLCFALDKEFLFEEKKNRILSGFVSCCLGVLSSLDQSSVRFIISDFLFTLRSLMRTFTLQHAELRTGSYVLLYSIIKSKSGLLCVLGFQFLCSSFFICKIMIIPLSNSQRHGTSKVPWAGTKKKKKKAIRKREDLKRRQEGVR